MIILLILPFLFGNFIQKWYIDAGMIGECGRILISDTDRDENLEFIFTTYGDWPAYIYFYELHLPDIWEIDSVSLPGGDLLWDSGDFDSDGFYDFALQFHIENPSLADGIMIFESPDSFSYPTQEVWRDTIGFPLVIPISVFDVDEDGIPEIVDGNGNEATDFNIFESNGNNSYELIYTGYPPFSSNSTFAFGNFDFDSANEFVFGDLDGWYAVYECNGNNSYVEILTQQLSTLNIKDCFSVPDADGDGKLEFVIKGFVVPTARINAFIFEAVGDNTYEIVKDFDLFGGSNDYYGGYSDAGDVDGDSIPEIVLEGCQNIYIIKSVGNDSLYVWDTLPGHLSGSNVRIFDIDDNGLSEIIISGNNETRIYEYEEGGIEEIRVETQVTKLEVFPNPFRDKVFIKYQGSVNNRIEIRIYNANGRLVRQFNNLISHQSQSFQIIWDGKDNGGKQLPSGVYFVHLETPNYNETRKVILLK